MKFLYQHRGTGKTTFLIRQSVKTGYPIAAASKRQAEYIKITAAAILGKDKAKELPEPIVATPQKMKELGYEVWFNECRPCDEDSFVPKTKLEYGEIRKGFNWWDGEEGK